MRNIINFIFYVIIWFLASLFFHPVTLLAEEAREGIPLIWSSPTRDPEALPDLTSGPLAEGCRTDLLFIPFLWTPLELVQPQVKLGVSRSALDLAKYI